VKLRLPRFGGGPRMAPPVPVRAPAPPSRPSAPVRTRPGGKAPRTPHLNRYGETRRQWLAVEARTIGDLFTPRRRRKQNRAEDLNLATAGRERAQRERADARTGERARRSRAVTNRARGPRTVTKRVARGRDVPTRVRDTRESAPKVRAHARAVPTRTGR